MTCSEVVLFSSVSHWAGANGEEVWRDWLLGGRAGDQKVEGQSQVSQTPPHSSKRPPHGQPVWKHNAALRQWPHRMPHAGSRLSPWSSSPSLPFVCRNAPRVVHQENMFAAARKPRDLIETCIIPNYSPLYCRDTSHMHCSCSHALTRQTMPTH